MLNSMGQRTTHGGQRKILFRGQSLIKMTFSQLQDDVKSVLMASIRGSTLHRS